MIRLEVGSPGAIEHDGFMTWCARREYNPPPFSHHGVVVRAAFKAVSCCYFYPAGPWFVVDGFVTNPEAPPRHRLKALELTLEQVLSYSASTGMKPIVTTKVRSILRKMRLMGFEVRAGVTMTRHTRSMFGDMPEPERKPKKPKGRSKKAAK